LYLENNHGDFHVIQHKGKTLRTEIFNQLHTAILDFLQQELQTQNQEKTVVITHHVPTLMNYLEIYKGSKLNEGFAVELFDTIESSGANYWIYGHSHFNTPEFYIGTAKMLTNQMGYMHHNEHLQYNPNATINL